MSTKLLIYLLPLLFIHILPCPVLAAPEFYITATDAKGVVGADKLLQIYLNTDSSTLNTIQTVLNYDSDYLSISNTSLNIYGSRCSFWSPANPGIGDGSTTTPYVYGSTQVIVACGFSGPNYYTSSDSTGDLILKTTFVPQATGTTTLSFTNTNVWSGAGNVSTPSGSSDYDLTIYASTLSAYGTAATPTPTTTTTTSVTTLTDSDLTFVEIGTTTSSTTGTSDDVTLSVVEEDNTVPAPPANLEKRPSATPFVFNLSQQSSSSQQETEEKQKEGEVLAVQSLRELLIPGKSQADKTVVLVNLISLLTFIIILVIVIWRLVLLQKSNRLKTRHLQELISSEISMLQSKLSAAETEEGKVKLKQELDETLKKVSK